MALPAQGLSEVAPPSHIRSVIFKGPTGDQFPIVQLGEPVTLEFDDLTAREQDYYYRVVHCNYDWTPSALLKSQYLTGIDNQRIVDYGNSYSTLQPYSNYRLRLPNEQVAPRVSGNYMLEIYDSSGALQFSRRFVVYQDLVKVPATVRRSRQFASMNEKQSVQFSIRPAGIRLINPKKEVKVALLQNYHWPTARFNIPPQFTIGTELVYKYDQETAFTAAMNTSISIRATSGLPRPLFRASRWKISTSTSSSRMPTDSTGPIRITRISTAIL